MHVIVSFLIIFKDAAGLAQLSSTVEDVFASGDLPRAAETLANMRHCLSAVGEVKFFIGNLSLLTCLLSARLIYLMVLVGC